MKIKALALSLIITVLVITVCGKALKKESVPGNTGNISEAKKQLTPENEIVKIHESEKKNDPAAEPEKAYMPDTGKQTHTSGNHKDQSKVTDIPSHSGFFTVNMSGYKGELFIGIADDKFYGTIRFFNWGNGVPQPLTDLKITDDKIFFKRVIKTKEELVKYGGSAFFEQDFYGIFTSDRKSIKGYYRYTGTQDNWEAVKK